MGRTKKKQSCKYGARCYRKNPKHLEEFGHPNVDDEGSYSDEKDSEVGEEPVTKRARMGAGQDSETSGKLQSDAESSKDKMEEGASEAAAVAAFGSDTEDNDEDTPPPSPKDVRENIKHKFLVEMPEDFYSFWDLAKLINGEDPCNAFKSSLGLQLVGPYDILAGKSKSKNSRGKRPCYLRHWRYYYDPPEFLTVVRAVDQSCFHFGYFRDDPFELPVFVACNTASQNGTIIPRGENIYAAMCWYIDDLIKKNKLEKDSLEKLKSKIAASARGNDYSLELKTKAMKARDKKVVTKSFHGAGIVVPVDENEIGYRELPESPANLKKMLKKIADSKTQEERDQNFDPLMEIIMLVQFANDECDYGEGLELGMDLFTYGGEVFHSTILNLLPLAYELLGRQPFKEISEAHMKCRSRDHALSELD